MANPKPDPLDDDIEDDFEEEELGFDDAFDNDDFDVEELEKPLRRSSRSRGRGGFNSRNKLPADWQDFDYGSDYDD